MWKTHRITIEKEVAVSSEKRVSALIRKVIRESLAAEGIQFPCEVNVLLTDDAGMQEINREQREIDAPTDVLSFPVWEFFPGERIESAEFSEAGTGLVVLGDMVLNLVRMYAQAAEYGHSKERELCYLVVHSVLHLLGYDHLDKGAQKQKMRRREEEILQKILPETADS